MKNVQRLLIAIFLVSGVIFLGDFIISSGHPFYELGAGIGSLFVSVVLLVVAVRASSK